MRCERKKEELMKERERARVRSEEKKEGRERERGERERTLHDVRKYAVFPCVFTDDERREGR